jgi:hypothetical protein
MLTALAGLGLGLAGVTAARAADPDLLSFGIGYFDETAINPGIGYFNEHANSAVPHQGALDFRGEYRFGYSLIKPYANLKPFVGVQVTSDGALYGATGLMLDIPLGPLIFTTSFGPGLYYRGNGKDLGSVIEFRTQFELGYGFENQSRISLAISHISNANISSTNPGADNITLYYHIPASWLFGGESTHYTNLR